MENMDTSAALYGCESLDERELAMMKFVNTLIGICVDMSLARYPEFKLGFFYVQGCRNSAKTHR